MVFVLVAEVGFKNKAFWVALIPAVLLLASQVCTIFGIQIGTVAVSDQLIGIAGTVFTIFALLGIVTDPPRKGLMIAIELWHIKSRIDKVKAGGHSPASFVMRVKLRKTLNKLFKAVTFLLGAQNTHNLFLKSIDICAFKAHNINVRGTANENKRPYRAFRTKRMEVQATWREPRHIRERRSKGKRREAQRNRRRVSKSNHQAARAEISPPPLGNNI